MKSLRPKNSKRYLTLASIVAGAGLLAGGSFALASGQFVGAPGSFLAAVFSAMSSKPAIVISNSAVSPRGSITTGGVRTIAVFEMSSKNVTHWATLRVLPINITTMGKTASSLKLSKFDLSYKYCIPAGVKYGYGYMGGNCGTISIPVNVVSSGGNTYTLALNSPVPVYPQATGQLVLRAYVAYGVGGSAGDSANLRVNIPTGAARGDQCRAYTYSSKTRSYGYSQCLPLQAHVYGASSNTISVQRSYGYGYCLI